MGGGVLTTDSLSLWGGGFLPQSDCRALLLKFWAFRGCLRLLGVQIRPTVACLIECLSGCAEW